MSESEVLLMLAAFAPVVISVVLYLLDKITAFGKLDNKYKQLIYGVIFGLLAVLGTEAGIPMNGAQVNCRDAAVLTAGLLFGAPAGIIAGLIGGIERWIAVYWGIGTFTRVACSVSTIIAGFYAAVLRKYMFENKRPGVLLACAIGVVMEVFHLTMVFITNMADPINAMAVVRACTTPMVLANGLSVMLAAIAITLLSRKGKIKVKTTARISQTIQRWLLVTVVLAFSATSVFVYSLQDRMAATQTDNTLTLAIDECANDINDASDSSMLYVARLIAKEDTTADRLDALAEKYGVTEINKVNKKGIIISTNIEGSKGFDMATGPQSASFLCLINDAQELVQEYGPISQDNTVYRKYAGIKTDYGFLQVGYDAEDLQRNLADNIKDISCNSHVGSTGFVFIVDAAQKVVSSPKGMETNVIQKVVDSADKPLSDTTSLLTMGDEKYYCRLSESEGYSIVAVLPQAEALQMRNIALYVNTFMEILVFAVLFILVYMLIRKVVVDKINDVNGSLAKISGGDLSVTVNVRSNAEFASLSDDINSTVDTLKRYIDEAGARIDKELEFAKNIQHSALPNVFPAYPKRKDFDVFASMTPAKEVGGDFYDFYLTGENKLNFLIADVSGKGIPAAMFMMRAKTELKSLTEAGQQINDVFTNGNQALCEGNDAGMFVTAWQGGIDLTTGKVVFANAGHNPPLVRKGDGKFEYLRARAGLVLAGMEGLRYKAQEFDLQPGDIVYLYTDGVTEATNAHNELYGEERLQNAINSREFENVTEMCRFIKADVDAFVGEAPQFDDITMLAFKYIGMPPIPSLHFDEAKIEDITAITEFVEAELEKMDCPMKTVIQLNIAIDEIFSNIVRYGYPKGPGPATVEIIERDEPHGVAIRFTDEGVPYNPLKKEDPDVTLSAEERKIGGLGIYMVKKTMDDMKYEYENDKNILTIVKRF